MEYNLTIKDSQNNVCTISLVDKVYKGTFDINRNGSNVQYTVTPTSIHYTKKMYQPGYMCLYVQISGSSKKNGNPTPSELSKFLINSVVNFKVDGHNVATNYVIFRIEPVFRKVSSVTSVYVKLHAYSPDYWMTLDKYSKCYVHKRFGLDIFTTEVQKFGFVTANETSKDGKVTIEKNIDCDNLQYINYKVAETSNTDTGVREFLQPYLVQYNESFYDFMVRTANRCGEFFFYEDGVLHLGLNPTSDDQGTLETFDSLTINDFLSDRKVSVTDVSRNDAKGGSRGYASAEAYDFEPAADEYLEPLPKDNATTFEKEYGNSKIAGLRWLFNVLGQKNYADAALLPAEDEAVKAIQSKELVSSKNGKYNDEFFDSGKYSPEQWKNMKSDSDQVSQFGTYSNEEVKNNFSHTNLNLEFYSAIRKLETMQANAMIRAELGSSYQDFRLGSKVSYDDTKYVVTSVSGTIELISSNWSQTQQIEAIPMVTPDKVPTANSVYYPIPFPHPAGSIRLSKPQVAYVTANNDPLFYGRVRVRYPWQQKPGDDDYKNENASPWLRVASPIAFNGGGFCMKLEVGEEVMLDYEGGNIERPFVAGSMFSKDSLVHKLQPTYAINISSPNGHYIRMKTPKDGRNMVAGLTPGISLAKGFMPSDDWGLDDTDKMCAGGIELGDKYGFVSLNLSTENRDISIKSPFGTVGISAFHGINIKAPNGNINLQGKNISLKASNNLSLLSGQNIKDLGDVKTMMADSALSLVTRYLDISILRTIYETLLRPIEGKLYIKSLRYLQLEAGDGATTVPMSAFSDSEKVKNASKSEALQRHEKAVRVNNTVSLLLHNLDALVDDYVTFHNDVVWSFSYYKRVVVRVGENANLSADYKTDKIIKTLVDSKDKVIATVRNKISQGDNNKAPENVIDAAESLFRKIKKFYGQGDGLIEDFKETNVSSKIKQLYYVTPFNNAVKDALNIFKDVFKYDNLKFTNNINKQDLKDNVVILKRKLLYKLMAELSHEKDLIVLKKGTAEPTYNDNESWSKYVENVSFYEPDTKSLLMKAVGAAAGADFDFDKEATRLKNLGSFEMGMWGTEQKGKILISDDKAQTISFEKGIPVVIPNKDVKLLSDLMNI